MKIAGADLGRMARRSGHCLPSDSDKFTIKLHSLPSKFLSFLSLLFADSATSSLLSRLFSRTSSRASLSRRGSFLSSVEKTRGGFFGGIVVYSLAITITHYTPAPSCPSFSLLSSLLSLRDVVPLRSSPPRTDSPYSLSHFVFPLCFFCRLFPLSFSDCSVASATAIPQLFSTFLTLIAVAVKNFACLPLPCTVSEFLLSFSLFFVLHPFLLVVLQLASIFFSSHFLPRTFFSPFAPLCIFFYS